MNVSIDYSHAILSAFIIFITLFVVEHVVKRALQHLGYQDTDKNKVARGQHARQTYIMTIIVSAVLSVIAVLNFHPLLTCDEIRSFDTRSVYVPLTIACAYFAYDMLAHNLTWDFITHHILGFVATILTFYSNSGYAAYYASICLIIELSTVILGIVRITRGRCQIVCSLLFFVAFTITRPIYLLFVIRNLFQCAEHEATYTGIIVLFIALYALNLHWFVIMCRKMYSTIFSKKV
jgi:hypothetical protein